MQKLITYLKQGKGRGLLAMLIFSILIALLLFGGLYSNLKSLPIVFPGLITEANLPWIYLTVILTGIVSNWLVYLLTVGISALLSLAFHLKLSKGALWRFASVSMILFTLISTLSMLIGMLFSFVLTLILPYQIMGIIGFMLQLSVFFTLLVMLIAFGLTEQKEGKKKK